MKTRVESSKKLSDILEESLTETICIDTEEHDCFTSCKERSDVLYEEIIHITFNDDENHKSPYDSLNEFISNTLNYFLFNYITQTLMCSKVLYQENGEYKDLDVDSNEGYELLDNGIEVMMLSGSSNGDLWYEIILRRVNNVLCVTIISKIRSVPKKNP